MRGVFSPLARISALEIPAEQVIARARVFLAIAGGLAVWLDPTQSDFQHLSYVIFGVYSVVALLLLFLIDLRLPTRREQRVMHFGDLVAVCGVLAVTEASTSPFFVMFLFVLLAAAVRWSWRGVLTTTAALLALFTLISAADVATGGELTYSYLIPRYAYLSVAGIMLAYVTVLRDRAQLRLSTLADWPGSEPASSGEAWMHDWFAHAARVFDSPRILAVWDQADEPYRRFALWNRGGFSEEQQPTADARDLVAPDLVEAAFVTPDVRSGVCLRTSGSYRSTMPLVHAAVVERYQMSSVASAPFAGSTCKGRIFILDRSSWSNDHLLMSQIIAQRLGVELDRESFDRQLHDAVAARERVRLARDLHDSTLQSLAAAAIQLKVAARQAHPDTKAQIDKVRAQLSAEQVRVRNFVQETRVTAMPHGPVGMLLTRTEAAGRQWGCGTRVSFDPVDLPVSPGLAHQLSLLFAEAVANSCRHGGANRVDISLSSWDGELTVLISDDGCGLPQKGAYDEAAVRQLGIGPTSIRERVSELGGSLSLESSPDGLTMHLRLPAS
jgi:signal transduction histidine kinase